MLLTAINISGQQFFLPFTTEGHQYPNASLTEQSNGLLTTYQNHWPSVPGAYNTAVISFNQLFTNASRGYGIGLMYNSEAGGMITEWKSRISYTQQIKISRHSHLAVGISGFIGRRNLQQLNTEGISFIDNISTPAESEFIIQGSYINKKHQVNLLLLHPQKALSQNTNYPPFSTAVKYAYKIDNSYTTTTNYIIPSLYVSISPVYLQTFHQAGVEINYNPMSYYLYFSGSLKKVINILHLGFGYQFSDFKFVYAYTANLSGLDLESGRNGAHEVTFLMNLQYKSKRAKKKAIKCPDI